MKIKDITGKRFGKLVVISVDTLKKGQYYWKCKCDCGTEKIIQGGHLRSGHTTSCGCSWYKYGKDNATWKGHKEISMRFYKSIIYNAQSRKLDFNISIEYLWDLFIKQSRLCALSGLPLVFGANNGKVEGTASLDRINSSMGYIVGNVQWVHKTVNNMKWDMSQEYFLQLCKTISEYHKIKNYGSPKIKQSGSFVF